MAVTAVGAGDVPEEMHEAENPSIF